MSIESLIIKHAELADLKRELKARGIEEFDLCTKRSRKHIPRFPEIFNGQDPTCIESVYDGFKDAMNEALEFGDQILFDDVWDESMAEGEVCQHCQNVRSLKKQRIKASSDLGQIRGAITRVGRRLAAAHATERNGRVSMTGAVKIEQSVVYCAGGRRWLTLKAACNSAARKKIMERCDCDRGDEVTPPETCEYHKEARYPIILRRLSAKYRKAFLKKDASLAITSTTTQEQDHE